eukprot:403348489
MKTSDSIYLNTALGAGQYPQISSLVSVTNHSHQFTLINSKFSDNSVVKGAVYLEFIEASWKNYPQTIINNIFENNAGIFANVALFIRVWTSASNYQTLPTQDQQCTGFDISYNQFKNNYGCPQYGGSIFQFECLSTYQGEYGDINDMDLILLNDNSTIREGTFDPYTESDIKNTLRESSYQFQDYEPNYLEVYSFDNINTYQVDKTSTTMNHNTFESNFASYNKGIMDISGIKLLNIYNTSFTNNGESTYEVIKHLQSESGKQMINLAFSQNSEYTQALTPGSGIDYQYMISLIYIQHCSQLLLDTVTFDSNWIGSSNQSSSISSSTSTNSIKNTTQTTTTYKYRAQLLMLNNFYGSLEIKNSQISNQVGLLNDFAYQFFSAFETTYTQGGSVLPLISFQVGQSQVKAITIESTKFSNLLFSNDQIYDSSFFQYTISQKNNYPLDKFTLSLCKFENISCYNCVKKQFFVVNTIDLELSDLNITNINYHYTATQYPSFFVFNLFSQQIKKLIDSESLELIIPGGVKDMPIIKLGQNISVDKLRGGFGGIYNLQQSPYSQDAINSNFVLQGGILYGSYSKILQNQLIGFINITYSNFLKSFSGQKGMGIYLNQKQSILINYQLNNGSCKAPQVLEDIIATQVSINDTDSDSDSDGLVDSTSDFMKPVRDGNQYDLGSFIALYSQDQVIYNAQQNMFSACVQAYYGSIMDVRSAYSSINDFSSFYIFSAAVKGGIFYCVNCYIFDIEKPLFTFAFAYQGGISYLDYDDSYTSAPLYQNDTYPIKLNFQSYYLEGVIGWYSGGIVKINGKTKKFDILIKDSQLGSISNGEEQFFEDSEYGGGNILHIKAKFINITLVNTSIYNLYGGPYGVSNIECLQNGIVIYGKAVNKINLTIEHSYFNIRATLTNVTDVVSLIQALISNSKDRGTGFYLNSQNSSLVFINSTNNTYTKFIGAGSSDIGGGVFRLSSNSTFVDNGSLFLYNAAGEGGNIFCSRCNIDMQNSNIQNGIAAKGGFVYVDEDQINIKMKNVTVNYTMTNDAGGFLYFMQDITYRLAGNLTFENVRFSNTGSYFGGGLMALNCENCNVNFTGCNFADSGVGGMDAGKGTANDGGFFHVTGVKQFLVKDSVFTNLEGKKLLETFMKISGLEKDFDYYHANFGTQILFAEITRYAIFTFDNVTIKHHENFEMEIFLDELESLNENLRSVINTYQYLIKVNCEGAALSCKVISKNSLYTNNLLGKAGSIYNLKSVDFYDSNSMYLFNVAVTGGTISAQNSNLTITSNFYMYNYAFSGGVLQVIDECNVYVSNTTFIDNGVKYKGGIFDVVLATSSSNDQTTIKITDCLFQDNFANYSGGVIQMENENVRLIAYNNVFSKNTAGTLNGGVFSILNAYYIDIRNNQFTQIGGTGQGTLLFAQSLGIENITLINNTVQCTDTYNQSVVTQIIKNDTKYLYDNTIYIGEVQKVLSKYNTFTQCVYNNEGGVFYLDKTNFTDIGSKFTYNSAFYGGVIKCSQCNLDLTDSIFENNIAYDGGVIILDNSATMTAEYIEMSYNLVINQAGCILARTNSYFSIINSMFNQNIANVSSSVVQALGTSNPYFEYQKYLVDQFQLVDQDKTTGSFILCILQVQLTILNSQFVNGYSSMGGAIFISGDSSIIISTTKFISNFANQYGGSIYGTGFALLQIDSNSEFTDGYAKFQGDDIFVRNSENITLKEVKSKSKYFSNSLYFETVNGLLDQVEIKDNFNLSTSAVGGGGLICLDCFNLIIKFSLFKNLKSQSGGCVYVYQTSNSRGSSVYKIQNSTFQNCTALSGKGGALYLMNIENLTVQNSKFLDSSSPKEGGAIYFQCDYLTGTTCILQANEEVQFINNSAGISGGALFWNDVEPVYNISNLKFLNNKALIYGDNVGSFAQRITTITFQQAMNSRGQYGFRRQLEQTDVQITSEQKSTQNQTLDSYRSGAVIPTFYMGLVDKYGQIVKTDSSSKIQNGTFEIVNLQFTGTPGQNYKIQLFTDGIDMTKPSNKLYLQEMKAKTNDITFDLKMELRECQIGEQFADSGQCNQCSNRTEYSLVKQNSPGTCKSCPTDKAVCLGGSDIGPKPSFWRKNNYTDTFIQCLRVQSCLGMVYPEKNPMGSCQYGYRGVMCADCISGYSREKEFACQQCPDTYWNALRLIITAMAAGLALAMLIKSTLKGATARKNVMSIYTKILMNHLSLLLIATSFNFQWPDLINNFLNSFKPASQATQQILSFDCLVTDTMNITADSPGFLRPVYIKMTTMAILPFILAILCFAVWWIISQKKKDENLLRTKAISSIVIVLFFVYSSIVQSMLDMFNCIDVDGESRLKIDLEVVCYKGQHTFWSMFVAVPGILVWGVGVPMLSYMLMNNEKHRLDSIEIKAKYGFLYRGYKRKYFYYESIVMYRKTIIIFVSVFMVSFGVIVQALVILILLIAGLSMQLILKPYQTYALNHLELLSIFASGITIYIGIFFIINSASSTDNQSAFQYNNSKLFFFVIIIISNINFFAIWGLYFLIELKEYLIKKMPWLYLNIFLCGNREKLKLHQFEADVREENEVLREEYMNSLKVLREAYDKGQIVLNQTVLERFKVYLNLERVYDNIGLRKQYFENEHTVLRKQRLKSDKHNLEALNSSESMKDENHIKLLMKFDSVNKKETMIDNIDIDFEDRYRSLINSSNSGQYNFGSSFAQKDSQFLKLGKSLTKFDILIDKLSETKKEHGPQSSKNKKFGNDVLNDQQTSQSDKKPSSISNKGPIIDEMEEFQEDQTLNESQRPLILDKSRYQSQLNDSSATFSPIKLNLNNDDQFLKPTMTKDVNDLRRQGFTKTTNQSRRKSQMKEKQLMASINRLIEIDEIGEDRIINNEQRFQQEFQNMITHKQQQEQINEEKDQLYFVKGSKRKLNIQELRRRREKEIMQSIKSGIKNQYKRIRKELKHKNNLNDQEIQDLKKEETQLRPQLTILQGDIPNEIILQNLKKKRTLRRNNFISGNDIELQDVDYEINQYVQESARDLLVVQDIHNSVDIKSDALINPIKLQNAGIIKEKNGVQDQTQKNQLERIKENNQRQLQSKSANTLKNLDIDRYKKLNHDTQHQRMKGQSQQFKNNTQDEDQVNIGFDEKNDGDILYDQDSSLIITSNEDDSERMKLKSFKYNEVNQDFIKNNQNDTSYARSLRNFPTGKSQNTVKIFIDKDKMDKELLQTKQLPQDLDLSDDENLIKNFKQKALDRYKNSSEESQKQLMEQNKEQNVSLSQNQDFKF